MRAVLQRLAELRSLMRRLEYDYLKQDVLDLLAESREGVERVRQIVADMKGLAHAGSSRWQWADLHEGLDSTLNIIWNELKYKCTVVKHYDPTLPQVYCIASQLNQVFMNLLVNAAHAITAERGTITISTGVDGPNVWVEVADTGAGIAQENLKRIFDPFFTTKPVGKGTGLGLSLSYGIVQKHSGRMEVHSELGVGTRFRITLPIKHEEAATQPAA